MTPTIAMRHLLWKDYRQARPALWACLIMLACIQMLHLVAQLFDPRTDTTTVQGAYFIALIAPTLVAMACSGLLIGQERQTRTWNWSSSLPVSWSSALASKFIVWLVASIVTTVVLLAVYAVLYRLALLSGRSPTASVASQISEIQVMQVMLLLVPIEVFVIFSIAALLWNDTLLALVISAIALCAGHLLIVDAGTRMIHGVPPNFPSRLQDHLLTAVTLLVLAVGLAALGLCYAFRWRWTSGQLASLSLRGSRWFGGGKPGGDTSLAYAPGYRVGRPSETAMLFVHALRSGLGIRVAIVIAALALLAGAPEEWRIFPPVIVAASLLLGVSVFGGEHPQGRYRFFADRGASWVRFLVAHVVVGLGWQVALFALACGLLVWQGSRTDFGFPSVLGVALAAFGLGMLSSLCISNSVIAAAFAGTALFACAICYEIADSYWTALVGARGFVTSALPLTIAIMSADLIYQARRWFVFDRPHPFRVLPAAGLIGLFAPIWLWLTFGYLTIPAVPWEGVPADQLTLQTQARLPRFSTHMLRLNATMHMPPLSPSLPVAQERVAELYRELLPQMRGGAGSPQTLRGWQIIIARLSDELADADAFVSAQPENIQTYSDAITQTAIMGVAATQARNREVALDAWRLNRSLLELGDSNPDLATVGVIARTVTYGLWNLLNDDDLRFLEDEGDEVDLSALLPSRVDNRVWTQALRKHWTVRKLGLRSDTVPDWLRFQPGQQTKGLRWTWMYYPPFRWAVERQMASQLKEELDSVESHTPPATLEGVSWLAAHDPLVYQLQLLGQFEQLVSARVEQVEGDDVR